MKRILRFIGRMFRSIFHKKKIIEQFPKKRKCIFKDKTGPCYGIGSDPGGYSISVFNNGDVVACAYLFGREKPVKKIFLGCVPLIK